MQVNFGRAVLDTRWAAHACRPAVLALACMQSACTLVGYDELTTSSRSADDLDGAAAPAPALPEGGDTPRDAGLPEDARADAGSAKGDDGDAGPADSAVDARASQLEDGWWEGVAPSGPSCRDDSACYPVCPNPGDRCVLPCDGASSCEARCLEETACRVDCGHASDCYMACKVDGQCWLDCQGSALCKAFCTTGSRCQVDCTGAEVCAVECLAGASCDVDCTGDVDCSRYVCAPGAACLMHCGEQGCNFVCQGQGQSCPDHHEVCNRDCP